MSGEMEFSGNVSLAADEGLQHDSGCDLATFLIDRAVQNTTLANYFHW